MSSGLVVELGVKGWESESFCSCHLPFWLPCREGNYSGFCEALAVGGCQDAAISVTLAQPQEFDCPLIGVSKGFQTLSGYLKHEVLGRNCRFLNRGCAIPQEDRLKLRASWTKSFFAQPWSQNRRTWQVKSISLCPSLPRQFKQLVDLVL